MSPPYRPSPRNLRTTTALVLVAALAGGCSAIDRLKNIGEQPKLSAIENPTTQPGYKPVQMPMPTPQPAVYNPNSLWRNGSRAFFKDQRAQQVGDLLTVTVNITDTAQFANETQLSRTGNINVSGSTTVSAVISRIPFGTGYQITMRGASADGSAVCMGSATFDVDSPNTKAVALHMTCELQPTTGSILINGTLNICPRIDGVDASPAEVIFGNSISLAATASDLDKAPSQLSFHWTATSGTFSDAGTTGPTWTCNKVGRATLTVAASDGDSACASSRSVDVVCSEPPLIDPGPT